MAISRHDTRYSLFHRSSRWMLALAVAASTFIMGCGTVGSNANSGNTEPSQPPPTDTVSGTIRINGVPIQGATVIAFSGNSNVVVQTTTTDGNGNYTFSGLQTAGNVTPNYQFWPTLAGYAFYPSLGTGSRTNYQWASAPQNWFVSNGAAITRADHTGAFSNASGGSGMITTVINLFAVANDSLTGANFNAFNGTNPPASLAATGQQTSYASGDDASEKKGVAWPTTRFVDNQNGTVTDNLTGLIWLKNAGCFAPATWASALADVNNLSSGACGLADQSTAGQWRLPNVVELESVVDVSAQNPAVTAGSPFINVSSGIYWSSTAYFGGAEGTTNAWAIRFSDGRYMNDGSSNLMATSTNAVWAVKGVGGGSVRLQSTGAYVPFGSGDDGNVQSGAPLTFPRMRDNGDGTVTDTVTGLIWMKKADCIFSPWAAAVAAVNSLASGQCGLTDGSVAGNWRMPNRKELLSLSDRAQNNQADYFDETFVSGTASINSQPAVFTNFVQFQYYWTSTTNAANTGEAWTVFSCDFGVYDILKTTAGYTLAVR